MCKDFDWRKTLKIGDVIDVSDTANVWYNATVLKTFEEVDEDTETCVQRTGQNKDAGR